MEDQTLLRLAEILVFEDHSEVAAYNFFRACCYKWPGFELELLKSSLDKDYFGGLSFPPVTKEVALVILFIVRGASQTEGAERAKLLVLAQAYILVFKNLLDGKIQEKIEADQRIANKVAENLIKSLREPR